MAAAAAADRAPAPQTHVLGALSEQGQHVQGPEGPGQIFDGLDQALGWPQRGLGSPVSAIAPLAAQRSTRGSSDPRQGNVSRFSNT